MQKRWSVFGLISLLLVPSVLADLSFSSIWNTIMGVGNLGFLGFQNQEVVTGLTRILLWILIFTVMFAIIRGLGGKDDSKGIFSFLRHQQAAVVALVVATIAAIFLPMHVILAVGAGWATAVALLLIGAPIIGFGYLLITYPGKERETKATVLIKILICLLMLWILTAVKFHVGKLAGLTV